MWQRIVGILALSTAPYVNGPTPTQPGQATAYHITGRCHDRGTAVGVRATIYCVQDQTRRLLATSNNDGTFDVLVPVSAIHLILEERTYRPVTIPIHFTSGIPADTRFSIFNWGMMTPADSMAVPLPPADENALSLFISAPDSCVVVGINYKLASVTTAKSRSVTTRIKPKQALTLPFSVEPGSYVATLSTHDGRVISSEPVTTRPGITFKAVRIANPVDLEPGNRASDFKASTTAVLYFDQSSYELRLSAKTTLDSIARLLTGQLTLLATVTGFTDNVGNRDQNVSLSAYRAKTVEAYLKQRGVSPNQLISRGNGPDQMASAEAAESIKVKSRRVEILLTPK